MARARWVMAMLVVAAGQGAGPAAAQSPGLTEEQRADAVRIGAIAALAPVCGLRDAEWAGDLRRAAIASVTGSHAHDDAGLLAAAGSDLAIGALSFADAEALEGFAEAPAPDTCDPLAHGEALRQADDLVRSFRAQAPAS